MYGRISLVDRVRRRGRVGEFSFGRDLHVVCVPCDGLDRRSSAQIEQVAVFALTKTEARTASRMCVAAADC
jgi:hypothetical protein